MILNKRSSFSNCLLSCHFIVWLQPILHRNINNPFVGLTTKRSFSSCRFILNPIPVCTIFRYSNRHFFDLSSIFFTGRLVDGLDGSVTHLLVLCQEPIFETIFGAGLSNEDLIILLNGLFYSVSYFPFGSRFIGMTRRCVFISHANFDFVCLRPRVMPL